MRWGRSRRRLALALASSLAVEVVAVLMTAGTPRAAGHHCVRVDVSGPPPSTVETTTPCTVHEPGSHSCTTAPLVVASAVVCVEPPDYYPAPRPRPGG